MRRSAELAIAAASAALGFAVPPGHESSLLGLMVLFYWPVLVALLTAVAATFRATVMATRRGDMRARMSLGDSRGHIIRAEARRGARAGLAWGGSGLVGGALIRQALAGVGTYGLDTMAIQAHLAILAAAVASASLAWATAAGWATRETMLATRSAPRSSRQRWSRSRTAYAGLGVLAVWSVAASAGLVTLETSGPGVVILSIVTQMGLWIALPALLIAAGARMGSTVVRGLASVMRRGANAGSTRALAADGLRREAPLRTAAIASIGAVIALSVAVSGLLNGLEARNEAAAILEPDAMISTVELGWLGDTRGVTSGGAGWAPAGVPPQVVEELDADPRLTVVPAAVLVTDPEPGALWAGWGDRRTYLPVDPRALDSIAPHGLRPLYFDGATALGTGASTISMRGVSADVESPSVAAPFATIPRDWAHDTFGAASDAALLVYLTEAPRGRGAPSTADEVRTVLSDHDLGALWVRVPASDWGTPGATADARVLVGYAGPFVLVAIAMVVSVSAATQRLRGREHATMLALGASPRALRHASALEAGTVTAVAGTLGVAFGAAMTATMSVLNGTGSWSIVMWNVGFDLSLVPWATIIGMVLGATALAAAFAALVRVRVDRTSPTEQLREAEKEGVL